MGHWLVGLNSCRARPSRESPTGGWEGMMWHRGNPFPQDTGRREGPRTHPGSAGKGHTHKEGAGLGSPEEGCYGNREKVRQVSGMARRPSPASTEKMEHNRMNAECLVLQDHMRQVRACLSSSLLPSLHPSIPPGPDSGEKTPQGFHSLQGPSIMKP